MQRPHLAAVMATAGMGLSMTRIVRSLLALVLLTALPLTAQALEPVAMAKSSFLNLKQDAEEAAQAGKQLMLMFEQEGCVYCMEMRRVNFADREIAEFIAAHFDLIQLDIWGDREVTDFTGRTLSEKDYARELKVQFTPMTLFVNGEGQELFRMAGYYKPPMYKAALEYVAGGHYATQKFREYARNVPQQETSGILHQEPFFSATDDLQALAKEAAADHKGVALLFEQKHCASCDEMHREALADAVAVERLTSKFKVTQLDLWGQRALKGLDGAATTEAKLGEALDIRYTPTLVFFDPDGQEIFRYDIYRKAEHFRIVMLYLQSGAYTRYQSFQDWLRLDYEKRPH